ncbi:MAG: hypothetical protein JSS69_15835 [Acidobacteria bacterium]|nr:hypothetical protein [Acidobacteriota bacterium]
MTEKQVILLKTGIAAALVLLAAALRILPHPLNLTPIGAMALFSGSVFREKWLKFVFPLIALFAGDLAVGFHILIPIVYLSFLLSVGIGMWIGEKRGLARISAGTLLGAIQFFLVTNFAVWVAFATYPKSFAGLIACYTGGIPLFWNTLAGDGLYAALLFGGYALAEHLVKRSARVSEVRF